MALLPPPPEPDCWQLVGVEDASTPPTVARVLQTAGSRRQWREAGFPVLFDADGEVKHVQRCGRVYRFERVDAAAGLTPPPPFAR